VALPLRTRRHTHSTHTHARQHHYSRTHRRTRPRPIFPAAGPPRDIIIIRRTRAQRYTARPIVKYVPAGKRPQARARADRVVSCRIVSRRGRHVGPIRVRCTHKAADPDRSDRLGSKYRTPRRPPATACVTRANGKHGPGGGGT